MGLAERSENHNCVWDLFHIVNRVRNMLVKIFM